MKVTEEIKKVKNVFFEKDFLKRIILMVFPKQCKREVSTRINLKFSRRSPIGTKNVEDPNPLRVPKNSEVNATRPRRKS